MRPRFSTTIRTWYDQSTHRCEPRSLAGLRNLCTVLKAADLNTARTLWLIEYSALVGCLS